MIISEVTLSEIQPIRHDNQPCDCGNVARYRVPVRLGSADSHRFRADCLALCEDCYRAYLEIEQPALCREPAILFGLRLQGATA